MILRTINIVRIIIINGSTISKIATSTPSSVKVSEISSRNISTKMYVNTPPIKVTIIFIHDIMVCSIKYLY